MLYVHCIYTTYIYSVHISCIEMKFVKNVDVKLIYKRKIPYFKGFTHTPYK